VPYPRIPLRKPFLLPKATVFYRAPEGSERFWRVQVVGKSANICACAFFGFFREPIFGSFSVVLAVKRKLALTFQGGKRLLQGPPVKFILDALVL
jgi:hypothetical protein